MDYKTFGKVLLASVAFSAVIASGKLNDLAGRSSVLADSAYTYTAADIIRLKQCFMGKVELEPEEYDKYDFNGDGVINLRDMNLAAMLLTQEISLPAVTTTEPVVTDIPEITMPVTTARYMDSIPEIPYATVIEPEKPVTASETTTEATTTAEVTTTTEATTTTVITTTEAPVTTTVTTTTEAPVTTEEVLPSAGEPVKIDVDSILQMPELPKGSEATALAMILNHYGFNADKALLADLMPKFNFYIIDDVLYGADFINTYPGNPASAVSGYGCYTPCMVTTADNYFKQTGNVNYKLTDLTGTDFDSLLAYIDAGRPVMVWATIDMIEPEYTKSWKTPDGRDVQWLENEHCFVLTGYDKAANRVFVNDPQKGKVTYSLSVFRFRYNQMGKYAAVLSGGDIKEVTLPPSASQPSAPSDCKYKVGDEVEYAGPVYYSANGGKSVDVEGTYEITEILEDDTKPYRIRLGTAGWVPIDFK